MSEKQLNGRVALTTGGSRGLGKAMAVALAGINIRITGTDILIDGGWCAQ